MAPRYSAYRFFARQTLGNDARFVLSAPGSPSTRPREHLDSPGRLRDSNMLSHHSKPCDSNQTADSQNRCRCERCSRDDAYINDVVTREAFSRNLSLIDLRVMFDADEDFANPIEPSVQGGMKLARAIHRFASMPHGETRVIR